MQALQAAAVWAVGKGASALSPATPQADVIRGLFVGVIIMSAAIALLVIVLVTWTLLRYRDRGVIPAQNDGNKTVEIIYTVGPLLLMIALFVCTVAVMRRAEPAPGKAGAKPDLVIIAHQWWWELHYPNAGVVSANDIHLPAGVPMQIELRSADVIHELWAPDLAPKIDLVPGHVNHLVLNAPNVGIYQGTCAEFCGAGHAWMRFRVIVQSPADFAAWEKSQQQPPPKMTGIAEAGRKMFLSETCVQCHTVAGTDAKGNAGPDLTHFASRGILAAGALDNTSANLRLWLKNPQAVKPGCYMPNMKLSQKQIDEIAAYLELLK